MTFNNWLPNPENYSQPSFNPPIVAPDVDPDEGATMLVAFNPAWLPFIEGALDQMTLPATYEGTEAEIKLAMNRAYMLRDMFAVGVDAVPAPYWDDTESADNQATSETQPWYGNWVDGEFVENIGTWIIAGFVAYAATPAAAIAFLTIAPKFRLAFKTGDIGGIIRVFIDAQDAGTVDTFSADPGIIEKDFVADPENETHQIVLVLEE